MMKFYLVTYGPFSKCQFVAANEVRSFVKSLPESEQRCVMITETDMTLDDLEYMERSQVIIERLEREATEVKMNVADRLKFKGKRAV